MSKAGYSLRCVSLALIALVGLSLASCAPYGSYAIGGEKNLGLIVLSPENATIDVGQSLSYTVTVTNAGKTVTGAVTDFNWLSTDPGVATVDDHGVAHGLKPGSTVIKAQAKADKSDAGSTSLNVVTAAPVAMLAATQQSVLVRLADGREVSYVPDSARHSLRVSTRYPDGSDSVCEISVSEIADREWLALAPAGDRLYVLSRDARRLLAFVLDPHSGDVGEHPHQVRVDADVFAIVPDEDGGIRLRHLDGRYSRLQF